MRAPRLFSAMILLICFDTFVRADDRNILAEIDVAKDGALLIVPIESEGRTDNYLLDTGACKTCVPLEVAANWKPIRFEAVRDPTETVKCPVYERPESEMFAGMVLRRKTELYSVELREMSEASGVNIQGVLGMSDLKRFVIQIDFDLGKLRILRSANEDCGDKFRLGSDHDCPTVKLSIGETIIDAIVDTGAGNDLLLSNDVFDRLVKHGQIVLAADTDAATFVGNRKLSKGTLRKTSLGSFEYKGLRVAKTQINAIGSTYLSHFLVTLDFPKQAMYLKPGKNYDRPAYHDALGIGIRLRAKAVVVEEVRSESPGDIAGIQKSDVLRQINGRDASSLSLFEIRRLFCEDGKTLKLRFERDGKPRDVTITLRKYD